MHYNITSYFLGQTPSGPRAEISPRYQQVYEGQPFEFHCQATGYPQPEIRWERANGPLSQEARVYGSVLRFSAVRKSDEDEYTCIATNNVGVHEVKSILYVKGNLIEKTIN